MLKLLSARRTLLARPQIRVFSAFSLYRAMASMYKVGSTGQLQDGKMVSVDVEGVEGAKVLLSQTNGKIFATGANCTHYGAPLANGVLTSTGQINCPWHGACFSSATGDIEDGPGLDRINSYPVTVKGSDIYVSAEPDQLKAGRTLPCTSAKSTNTDEKIVIVGGGASGGVCSEVLRSSGFKGQITVLSAEPYYAIDRTKLSKALIDDHTKVQIRSAEFYKSLDIDYVTGVNVNSVDVAARKVGLTNGAQYEYTKLILATGGIPKTLPLEGFDASNVHLLRWVTDAQKITSSRDLNNGATKNVVIIGSSFIGMELAIALKDHNVHVVGMEGAPFANALGEEIGKGLQKLHESNGTKFYLNAQVDKANVSNGKATSVRLKDGTEIPADFVIVGAGIRPALDFLPTGFPIMQDGGLSVDSNLQVKGMEGVYAMGDIAHFPLDFTGTSQRIEHWDVAMHHARSLGRHLAGQSPAQVSSLIPVFWSAQGGSLRYAGSSNDVDGVHIVGNPHEGKFAGYYYKGDNVRGVVTMAMDPIMAKMVTLWKENRNVKLSDIKNANNILDLK